MRLHSGVAAAAVLLALHLHASLVCGQTRKGASQGTPWDPYNLSLDETGDWVGSEIESAFANSRPLAVGKFALFTSYETRPNCTLACSERMEVPIDGGAPGKALCFVIVKGFRLWGTWNAGYCLYFDPTIGLPTWAGSNYQCGCTNEFSARSLFWNQTLACVTGPSAVVPTPVPCRIKRYDGGNDFHMGWIVNDTCWVNAPGFGPSNSRKVRTFRAGGPYEMSVLCRRGPDLTTPPAWANQGYYIPYQLGQQKERAQFVVSAAQSGIDFMWFGDSIVQKIQLNPASLAAWNYNFGMWKTVRMGVGGDEIEPLTWRLIAGGNKPPVDPKVVAFLIGTNNFLQRPWDPIPQTMQRLEYLLRWTKAAMPRSRIILMSVLPLKKPVPVPRLNEQYRLLAEKLAITWAPCGQSINPADPGMLADGVHPTPAGYNIIFACLRQYVEALMY